MAALLDIRLIEILIARWRDDADGVTAMGYSQQGDRIHECAAELQDVLIALQHISKREIEDAFKAGWLHREQDWTETTHGIRGAHTNMTREQACRAYLRGEDIRFVIEQIAALDAAPEQSKFSGAGGGGVGFPAVHASESAPAPETLDAAPEQPREGE